jgi:glycosyltransferase involved in cell wall biosynthesis
MKPTAPITVCIPCYKYHIPKLKRCLDSIELQTIHPEEVIVSCSSSIKEDIPFANEYSFQLQIITTTERKNAAQNRNIAAAAAKSKYVSFFDADDSMHPQRIEAIYTAFQKFPDTEIILHSFYLPEESKQIQEWTMHSQFSFFQNKIVRADSGCVVYTSTGRQHIHHAQVSVSKRVWYIVKFNEGVNYERREDTVFCNSCFSRIPTIQSVYILEQLSKYFEEGATHAI